MNRASVLQVVRRHNSRAITFSVLSRALITNTKQRKRSQQARCELHALIRELVAEGHLHIHETTRGRGGRGLLIEVVQSTHEVRKP